MVEDFNEEAAAEHFLNLLADVRDLLGLVENPRMLSFMIRWYRAGLLTDAKLTASDNKPMTAGRLYERLLTTWLEHEYVRQDEPGGPGALSVAERLDALGEVTLEVTLHLCRSGEASVRAAELGSATAKVADLARLQMRPAEAAQAGSSTVLVCVGEDAFGFILLRRSVVITCSARLALQRSPGCNWPSCSATWFQDSDWGKASWRR